MRLTTFSDYSLRVLMFVAAAPEGRATISQVASAFNISENHLVKVVHFLGRHGILLNTRGRRGGLQLARPAHAINVGELVRLTEGGDMPAECFDKRTNTCALAGGCRLQGMLKRAVASFYEALDPYSIADLQRSAHLTYIKRRPGLAPRL
jgi:Rrf2 family nitric oxide-sensitive transcriptional repressor